ncbi:MAG: hypothetical protein D6797_02510 [Bdellovibrio sp.]|nr:MAG: hypothetical protein D6797_02510 [Bdellovibrio sp.]
MLLIKKKRAHTSQPSLYLIPNESGFWSLDFRLILLIQKNLIKGGKCPVLRRVFSVKRLDNRHLFQ